METAGRILIADDDPINLSLLSGLLADHHILQTASSGKEAIELAASWRPDLILLDVVMPEMDGYECCRAIRRDPELRGIKVIVISSKDMLSERIRGYECGADDYVTKPFEPLELQAKVRVFLRLKSMEEIDSLRRDLFTLLGHETRTPLQGIMGAAEILLSVKDLEVEDREKLLGAIVDSTAQLERLLERVRLLSELKAGLVEMDEERVDLLELARRAVDDARAVANEGVTFEVGGSSLVETRGDPKHLALVVSTLVENAARHGDAGTPVDVVVDGSSDKATVAVTNRGAGIDPEFLPKVFLGLAVPDVLHHSRGLALGLAIARTVAERHGGTIEVLSEPGGETTFTLRLPAGETTTGQ